MDLRLIKLIYETIRYIKPTQLYYQIYYRFFQKAGSVDTPNIIPIPPSTHFTSYFNVTESCQNGKTFTFLNLSHSFTKIDWNFSGFGKLWNYNLNYFDFLQQDSMSKETGLDLMLDFCAKRSSHKYAYEPYPISLRVINWVKFLSKYEINDYTINRQLYEDLYRLKSRPEYHILANHLFENGFGLLFGAYYFRDETLYKVAVNIIKSELKEQILSDGAHYELTPMYHQIILYRILDCYQLVSRNDWKNYELAQELKEIASRMLGWLDMLQFSNGDLPLVNDSTVDIAPTPVELLSYARNLGLEPRRHEFKDSGYRKFSNDKLELLFDAGQIAPSYQPGHAHADSLQILVYKNGVPVLVDTGISTYEKDERRHIERSTLSHNTVSVNRMNSSEIWSGFRVGRRAKVSILSEDEHSIAAEHDGYINLKLIHKREIKVLTNEFLIRDTMNGKTYNRLIEGHLHFHPDRKLELEGSNVFVDGEPFLEFDKNAILNVENYQYCNGFNTLMPSKKIVYQFSTEAAFLIKS